MNIPRKGVALAVFTAAWCHSCKGYEDALDGAEKEGVTVVRMDCDEEPATVAERNVMSVPTSILFIDGEEVTRWLGPQPKSVLVSAWSAASEARREMREKPKSANMTPPSYGHEKAGRKEEGRGEEEGQKVAKGKKAAA